LNTR